MIAIAYLTLTCVGIFLFVQLIRSFLWCFTSGGGKATAAAEYKRLKREDPDNSSIQNISKEEFTIPYIKDNGPNFWLYLGLIIALSVGAPALLGAVFFSALGL